MHPLILAGGALAAGWFAKSMIDKNKTSTAQQQAAFEQALGKAATELTQGKGYTVQLSIDSPKMGTKDAATASAVIRSTFEQLGWRVTSTPSPRTAAETQNFVSGRASQWVLQGQWTKAEKAMTQGPPWLGMAMAYEMPVK